MSSDPRSSDFVYKDYSLEQLDNWISDALNNELLTAQEIYDAIIKSVKDSVKYHKKELDRSKQLLCLMSENKSYICEATNDDWIDFWEEVSYPKEYDNLQYTEEEMNSMCDAAADKEERDLCREYNLREAEYYNKRALIDAEHKKQNKELEEIRKSGGFEWTPGS